MNNTTLEIHANNQPTVMERLLQVTRYRGFVINKLEMQQLGQTQLQVTMSVNSDRPIENLSRQLMKLFDVVDVSIVKS
ncbi:MAG: acetolactate synthase 2 small subunit [Xanthomonadales bacterium]|nr:acetolactate synthase 2 small subunit [Xanthomonadales bacterium]